MRNSTPSNLQPLVIVAVCLLILFAAASALAIFSSLLSFHWIGYASAVEAAARDREAVSATPLGIGLMAIVEVHLLLVASAVILPVGGAVGIWRGRSWAGTVVAALFLASVLLVFVSVPWGTILAVVAGAALIVLISARYWSTATGLPFDDVDRAWIAYFLLVSGGLVGLHNFFIRRAWAGFLCMLCTVLATFGWGSVAGYVAMAALVLLLVRDALLIPARSKLVGPPAVPRNRQFG